MRRSPSHRARSASRRVHLVVENLEVRQVLSTTMPMPGDSHQTFHPLFELKPYGGNGPAGGLSPQQVSTAYSFNQINLGGAALGAGQTIAIVDAYDNPNIQSDLNKFYQQFYGTAAPTVTRVGQNGGAVPGVDPSGGWELEEALDVEWASAMAPGAKILLVEANSANDSDLLAAVDYAAAHANVVSMSWGGGEWAGETSSSYNNHFIHSGVTFVASSGDNGAPASWPAISPDVISVGGTTLNLNSSNTRASETGWSGSGGGPSSYFSQPAYQNGVVTQTTARANPDVSYNADPSTGFSVYSSYPYNGSNLGWLAVGGTSAGAPQWASLIAIANQARANAGLSPLNSTSPTEVATTLYKSSKTAFYDVTSGVSTGSPHESSSSGYDLVTGIGSPIANSVVAALSGGAAQPQTDHIVVTGPTTATAGGQVFYTVAAYTPSNTLDTKFTGTVSLTSSDGQAVGLGTYTFNTTDAGSHGFYVTFKTAGSQNLTVTDLTKGAGSASVGVSVSPAQASKLTLSGLPSSAAVGAVLSFTVTTSDTYGNLATGFNGTVQFASSDSAAGLPSSYTFTSADRGSHTFNVTFRTTGTQTITASSSSLTVTSGNVSVSPSVPLNLTATVVSDTQIKLNWNAATGATNYLVERSTNSSSGFAQVASVSVATTTFSDSNLVAGTTYYYRVRANGGGLNSGYSNVIAATTTGGSASNTLYNNSYVPSIDYYSRGNYEVGTKIKTDVNGTISALRFYKQTWMDGYTHVGHIWSSNGTLLATALFTNETKSGWEQVTLSNPVSISANSVYVISFSTGGGYFGFNSTGLSGKGVDNGPLHALADGVAGADGVYSRGGSFPSSAASGWNFFVDTVFNPTSSSKAIGLFAQTLTTNSGSTFSVSSTSGGSTTTNSFLFAPPTADKTTNPTVTIPTKQSPTNTTSQGYLQTNASPIRRSFIITSGGTSRSNEILGSYRDSRG